MCWAMQSCPVPLLGCSRSLCACRALQPEGKAVPAPSWPGLGPGESAFPQPPCCQEAQEEGTPLLMGSSCWPVTPCSVFWCHATSVYGHGIANTGFKKPGPASAGPARKNLSCLGGFQTAAVSAEPGSSARQVRLAGSAAVRLSSGGSLQIRPQHPWSSQGGFPAALRTWHCLPPLQQMDTLKHGKLPHPRSPSHPVCLPSSADAVYG